MTTDTSEKGFKSLIVSSMTGLPLDSCAEVVCVRTEMTSESGHPDMSGQKRT